MDFLRVRRELPSIRKNGDSHRGGSVGATRRSGRGRLAEGGSMRDVPGEGRRPSGAVALVAWFAVAVAGPPLSRGLDGVRIAGVSGGFWYAELGAVLLLVAVLAAYASAESRADE